MFHRASTPRHYFTKGFSNFANEFSVMHTPDSLCNWEQISGLATLLAVLCPAEKVGQSDIRGTVKQRPTSLEFYIIHYINYYRANGCHVFYLVNSDVLPGEQ